MEIDYISQEINVYYYKIYYVQGMNNTTTANGEGSYWIMEKRIMG